jgi:hypothetical protein
MGIPEKKSKRWNPQAIADTYREALQAGELTEVSPLTLAGDREPRTWVLDPADKDPMDFAVHATVEFWDFPSATYGEELS